MRYLESSGRWVSTESPTAVVADDSDASARLVNQGLLHPSHLDATADSFLLKEGIAGPMSAYVRLTDGPGGQARWASYYDVLMSNPWGHGTIHTIARGLGRLPLKLYEPVHSDDVDPGTVAQIITPNRKTPEGRIVWALRYPNTLPDRSGKTANSPISRKALLYGTVVSKLIHANALWEKRRGADGEIVGFSYIPNEQISMNERALTYTISEPHFVGILGEQSPETERTLTADKVCHFGLWETGRRPWTPSPVRALHASIALYDAVSRHMSSFFQNGARVSGHLKLPEGKGANQQSITHAREEIKKLFSGSDNAGRVLITEADWQQMHREPEFDGIVSLMKFSRDEIFVTYGVPPPVMGVMDRAIMSNVREMRDQYVKDLIGPHAEFLAADFEAQVIDFEPGLRDKQIFAEFDLDEQLRPDVWTRAAAHRNMLLVRTPNEVRRMERLQQLTGDANPDGYADTIQRPLNESPITNLPDYNKRDEVLERRLDLEYIRFEQESQDTGDGGEAQAQARLEAERRALLDARRVSVEERRQAAQEQIEAERLALEAERLAIERERTARQLDLSERGHDEVNVPRVGQDDKRIDLEERRVEVTERLADHEIEHGRGNEPHGPNSEEPEDDDGQGGPVPPGNDDEPGDPPVPPGNGEDPPGDDDEPAPPVEEEDDAGDE